MYKSENKATQILKSSADKSESISIDFVFVIKCARECHLTRNNKKLHRGRVIFCDILDK